MAEHLGQCLSPPEPRWHETTQQTGGDGDAGRSGDDHPVKTNIGNPRELRRQQSRNDPVEGGGQRHAESAADDADSDAFDDPLAREPGSASAERSSQRHLPTALRRSRSPAMVAVGLPGLSTIRRCPV